MPQRHGVGAMVAAMLVLGVLACSTTGNASTRPGTGGGEVTGQGIGDPYYPDDGNLGYDVKHYDVRLSYGPDRHRIRATTTVTATAKEALSSFHLDLLGLRVSEVTVDGRSATFERTDAHEVVITPARAVASGVRFDTAVTYSGKPGVDPVDNFASGWHDADTAGGGFVAGEPHSCTVWYPCNDHPTDKATFALTATVPRPFSVISVGRQLPTWSSTRPDGTRVRKFRWRLGEPTTTYLTTIYIDSLTFERSTLRDGTPVVSAYGPKPGMAPRHEARLPDVLRVLGHRWGPYPAPQAGGIFVNGQVGFSLETFTRPLYSEGVRLPTIVHENAHQWWGDNVSIRRWRDICLSECFASYSVWLWKEHKGADLDQRYRNGVGGAKSGFLDAPLYDMGAGNEFDYEGVYLKGTYFLHALRNKVGDAAFFSALRAIQTNRARGNMSMLKLRDRLESRIDVDLTSFWQEWVLSTGRPSAENLYPGDL